MNKFTKNIGGELARWYPILDRRDFLKQYDGNGEHNITIMNHFGMAQNPNKLPHGRELEFDIECYLNYFLCTFYDGETGEYWEFEKKDESYFDMGSVLLILTHNTIVTFNGNGYDIPMCDYAVLDNASNYQLFNVSQDIIVDKKTKHRTAMVLDHIDIAPVLPLVASMKMYGCRSEFEELAELPVDPQMALTPEQMEAVRIYCRVDCRLTNHLKKKVSDQLELRRTLSDQYGIDLRSKSDPEIAEALIALFMKEHGKPVSKRKKKVHPFAYRVPSWVEFKSPEFREALAAVKASRFVCNKAGYVQMPKELHNAFHYNGASYQFGIGGLHSQEHGCVTIPTENQRFGEFDVN